MTRYYNNKGVLIYEDNTNDLEEVKKILEEKDLCVAVIEADGKMQCVKRGEYKEPFLLHCGKLYYFK